MIDDVGNDIQDSGAVKPNACQKCKKKFNAKQKRELIKSFAPSWSCKTCAEEIASEFDAIKHIMQNKEHDLEQSKTERVVDVKTILVGEKANIQTVNGKITILCGRCLNAQ